ncbi:hypothetical protein VFPPC_16437 [Pochonia chlamydosporia 170]|uniref:Uncharacterized protein n=1 Tax=Pochonia chlamydosporia 170 TaxID=1380566 RepID=A0A179FC99_METCM|nr:hypothetical protein VFPPC_16437 [Pochonia chlamydosporia 170]OAQ63195.1 hypothetical protein VFPPC_16437 [Pochonia chlamydosporia 170]
MAGEVCRRLVDPAGVHATGPALGITEGRSAGRGVSEMVRLFACFGNHSESPSVG